MVATRFNIFPGAATPLPPKLLELCRSKFFSLVADIAAKPLFWGSAAAASAAVAGEVPGMGGKKKKKSLSKKSAAAASSPGGSESSWGALEALWGLHEAWQGFEARGRKLVKGVSVGLDEKEACGVALAVVGRIRAGAARCVRKFGMSGVEIIGVIVVVVVVIVVVFVGGCGICVVCF